MGGDTRTRCLEAMGLVEWRLRTPPVDRAAGSGAHADGAADADADAHTPCSGDVATGVDWNGLAAEVSACTRCALHESRTRTVFGSGSRQAHWMLIGEAPGADEDRQGEPFVGRAGQLLSAMLAAIGLQREQVFITNILKCRPPRNRDPEAAEVAACADHLRRQLGLLEPRLILALGRVSAQSLLDTQAPLGRLRGRVHRHPQFHVPVVVTYHPAYLLRSPADKRKAWDDLLLASRVAAEEAGQ